MSTPCAGLETLPTELFVRITKQFTKEDLKGLSLVSKKCHSIVVEPLWKTAIIKPLSESDLHQIDAAAVPQSLLQFAQQLHLLSDFRLVLKDRCPHHKDASTHDASTPDGPTPAKVDEKGKSHAGSRPEAEGNDNQRPGYFHHLAHQAKSILRQLQHDQLHGFSWDLGTCVPPEILGPRGTVLLNNPSLRSLSLTTDPSCHEASAPNCEIDLSTLRQLQSLRWRGPGVCHFETLCHVIGNNSDHLQSLELNFISWHQFQKDLASERKIMRIPDEWCANKIFGLTNQPSQPVFPAVRELSLTQVPLGNGMGQRIGLETLVSLRLRKCPGWISFLEEITERGVPLRLKILEIRDSSSEAFADHEVVDNFLSCFEGLEELFLCYWNSTKRDYIERWKLLTSGVWKAAAHHRATLKRLGYNRRETVWVAPESDVPDEGLFSWAINKTDDGPSQHPLAGLNLDFIGLSCAPKLLVSILLPFAAKTSLKVLHIRQSGNGQSLVLKESEEMEMEKEEMETENEKIEDLDTTQQDLDEDQSDTADSYDAALRAWLRPEFKELAEWAFGPRGICSLQAIAYGDYTYGGKRPPPVDHPFFRNSSPRVDQLLFCRSRCSGDGDHSNFRVVRRKDPEARVLDEYRDTLQALPMESLLRYSR